MELLVGLKLFQDAWFRKDRDTRTWGIIHTVGIDADLGMAYNCTAPLDFISFEKDNGEWSLISTEPYEVQ